MGDFAVKWCRAMGFTLDPWQELILSHSMKRDSAGMWKSPQVGVTVPRQAGKSELLVARQTFGLFMLPDEKLILASAHLFATAQESFRKMLNKIDSHPELKARVLRVDAAHGKEGIELRDGSRIRFMARSKGASRGMSADLILADEAYDLSDDEMAAILPTLAARPNPQMWFASSAGMATSDVLWKVRERGIAQDPRLAYFEWSADEDASLDDPAAVVAANPGLGIRLSYQHVLDERSAMDEVSFARERLGIWEKLGEDGFIPPAKWSACLDQPLAEMVANGEVIEQKLSRVALGVDVPPDRSYASVCVAGFREDGSLFVELLERQLGTDWLPAYLGDLIAEGGKVPVLADGFSAVSSLALEFRQNRVPVKFVRSELYKKACGVFYDKVVQGGISHKGDPDLDAAVAGGQPSSKDKLWAWTSKSVDVSPLVAATLAVHGSLNRPSGEKTGKRRGAVFA